MTLNTLANTHICKQSCSRPNNTRRTCFNDTAVCRIANAILDKTVYKYERTIWCLALTVKKTTDTHSHTHMLTHMCNLQSNHIQEQGILRISWLTNT